MTTLSRLATTKTRTASNRVPVPQDVRRAVYRERETGVGYGNSSGYASERRYARDWAGQPLFRCG
ncbi:MAG: hypothetical protein ABIR05_04910 [Luteimonas sp.]